jgi:hypothetical protein
MALTPHESHELYVYYRASPERTEALAAAVQAMQQALCAAHPGLVARLLCRAELREGLHTWMEAYALPPGRSAVALAAAIEQAAVVLAPLLDGPRRSEHFVACAW